MTMANDFGGCESCDTNQQPIDRRIFVGNISYRVNRNELTKFFAQFGDVESCFMVHDHFHYRRKGIAFVTFMKDTDVDRVLTLENDQLMLDGRLLRVNHAEESERLKLHIPRREQQEHRLDTADDTSDADDADDADVLSECLDQVFVTGDGLHQLNDDILIKVFTYLPVKDRVVCERVCRRWRHLSRTSWSSIRHLHFKGIFSGFRGLTNKILQSVLCKGCTRLVSLDLSASVRALTEKALEIIGHYCEDLQFLNIDGLATTNKSVEILSKACVRLKWLSAQKCYVGEKGMWWVFHQSKALHYLNLSENPSITGQCFHMLGSSLTSAILNDCQQLSDVGVQKLAERSANLCDLELNRCWQLSDTSIQCLPRFVSDLQSLQLSGSYNSMTPAGLFPIASLPKLKELNVSFNQLVSDEFLRRLVEGCENISVLDVSGCGHNDLITPSGMSTFADFPHLTTLHVDYVIQFSDSPLKAVALNGTLESLSARACVQVTDCGVAFIAQHCWQLATLDLSSCVGVTNKTIYEFIASEDITSDDISRVKILHLTLGGTSVCTEELDVPAWMVIDSSDYSQMRLRADREIVLQPDSEDDDDVVEDEYNEPELKDLLDADDPFMEDEFNVS